MSRIAKMVLFAILNLVALGANYLIYILCIGVFGASVLLAAPVAWLVGTTLACIFNRLVVFRHEAQGFAEALREVIVFFASRLEVDCVGWSVVWVLADVMLLPKLPCMVLVEALVLVTNYFLNKYVVFVPKDRAYRAHVGVARSLSDAMQAAILFIAAGCLSALAVAGTMVSVLCLPNDTFIGVRHFIPVLIGLAVWFVVAVVLQSARLVPSVRSVAWVAFFAGVVLSALWVFIADCGPAYDSWDLSAAAFVLSDTKKVPVAYRGWLNSGYSAWALGWPGPPASQYSYMGRFPFQIPFLLFLHGCQLVAGKNFYLFYQLLNAIANGITFYLVVRIAHELTKSRLAAFLALGITILTVPLVCYATFIYGNLLSHPFALGAWLACLVGSRQDTPTFKRIALFVFAAVMLAVSSLIKSTMTIASIAFAVIMVLYALRYKAPWTLPVLVVPFLISSMVSNALIDHMEQMMHTNLHDPTPRVTWIVMGLGGGQELYMEESGEPSGFDMRRPGYFDSYVWETPHENGYATWDELNTQYLQKRLARFASDPDYLLRFFSLKLATEWLEATDECFDISYYEVTGPTVDPASRHRELTPFARALYEGSPHEVLVYFAELSHALAAVGALAWCLHLFRSRRRVGSLYLLGFVFFLGSALLYVFWENKSQYLLPAWTLLLPYAACGWKVLVAKAVALRARAEG